MSIPRLYVTGPLSAGRRIVLEGPRAHYVLHVLRLRAGAPLLLFDGRSGEWAASLAEVERHGVTAELKALAQAQPAASGPCLAFAPIRRSRLDWLVEKVVELGAAALVPVVTERTIVKLAQVERLQSIATEAAEQCGRLDVPIVAPPRALAEWLSARDPSRPLVLLDESGAGRPLLDLLDGDACDLLVGPEGGFAPAERGAVLAMPGAVAGDLGPLILRSETAALAALAAWRLARPPAPGAKRR